MAAKVAIAEKPVVARDIARAVLGAPENCPLPYTADGMTVCACAGHLLELKEPSDIDPSLGKPWSEDQLPVSIENWPKEPAKGKGGKVAEIAKLVEEAELVYHCGDVDEEGSLIVCELLDYLNYSGEVKRVRIADSVDDSIRKAFANAEGMDRTEREAASAYARQMADMAFGVSESRLATLRLGSYVHLGRVQTPTLGLVVDRTRAHAGHEARLFYELEVPVEFDAACPEKTVVFKLKPADRLLGEDGRVWDEGTLWSVARQLEGERTEVQATVKDVRKKPPLPYNLTTLTSDMSKRFKMSAKQVLDATQVLRDKHRAITYNRSDCSYLPEALHAEAKEVLSTAMANLGEAWYLDYSRKSRAFDDKSVDAHHGIIPQDMKVDLEALTPDQANVYRSICERYAMQFCGDKVDTVSESAAETRFGTLTHRAVRPSEPGWAAIRSPELEDDEERESKGAWVRPGTHGAAIGMGEVLEKKTTPPKLFTEGTLMSAMANISKYVSDQEVRKILVEKDAGKKGEGGGIGTVATRAAIIEKLKERGYIAAQKGKLRATDKGMQLYDAVPAEISGADLTARWWLVQQEVAAGRADANAVQRAVCESFEERRESAYAGESMRDRPEAVVVGRCPRCGEEVAKRGKSFSCATNKFKKTEDGSWEQVEGCGFRFAATWSGKAISLTQAARMLAGETVQMKGFTSKKTGNKFDCGLKVSKDGVEPVFKNAKKKGGR